MDGLRKALEGVLLEIQTELDNTADEVAKDQDTISEHRRALVERQAQIEAILEAATGVPADGEGGKEEGGEVELREELTMADQQIIDERQSGRRVAHRPAWLQPTTTTPTPTPSNAKPVLRERISERTVSLTKIMEKEEQMQSQVMAANLDRHSMTRSSLVDAESGGIYPVRGVKGGDRNGKSGE